MIWCAVLGALFTILVAEQQDVAASKPTQSLQDIVRQLTRATKAQEKELGVYSVNRRYSVRWKSRKDVDVLEVLWSYKPGAGKEFKVIKTGQTQEMSAMTAALPGAKMAKNDHEKATENSGLDGVSVESLDSQTAQQTGLPENTKGVVVTGVDQASAAAAAGLKEGDVIQEVNHSKVANSDDFTSAIGKSKGDSLLLVNRGGNKLYLAV